MQIYSCLRKKKKQCFNGIILKLIFFCKIIENNLSKNLVIIVVEIVIGGEFVITFLSLAVLVFIFVLKLPLYMRIRNITSLMNIELDILCDIYSQVGVGFDIDRECVMS